MSQNFINFNGTAQDSNNSRRAIVPDIEGLSSSLIYPGLPLSPQQQQQQQNQLQQLQHNYPQPWPIAQNWQSQRQEIFHYGRGSGHKTQEMDARGYFPLHEQEYAPLEEDEGSYGDGVTHSGSGPNKQPLKQGGITPGTKAPHEHPHTRLHEFLNHQVQRPTTSKTEEQEQTPNLAVDGALPKSDTSMLNDRAAELRARLLAKRGSTPGTPSQISKSSDPVKPKNNGASSSQRPMDGKHSTASAAAEKISGSIKRSTAVGKNVMDKSTKTTQMVPFEKKKTSADIDGLLAEGRAAAAAERNKTGQIPGLGGKAREGTKETGKVSSTNKNSSEKVQHDSKADDHRRSLNKSTSSSEMSELGEIRSDSGKASNVQKPLESVNSKAGKEKLVPIHEKSKQESHINNGVDRQSTKKPDGVGKVREAVNSTQTRPASSTKPSPSSPISTQLRDQFQGSRYDSRRDRYDHLLLDQDLRKDNEQDRRRDSDYKDRNADMRRTSGTRSYIHEPERVRADHHLETDIRRPQAGRHNVEESAQAAAEYKRELEERERRRQVSRQVADKADPPKGKRKKDGDAGGPRTPITKGIETQRNAANHENNNRDSNTRSGELGTVSFPKPSGDNHITEDVRDWLEMTGFSDPSYRKTALTRWRKIKALDLQKAELEREAQLEIAGRVHTTRAQSVLPETNVVPTSISPRVIQNSVLLMPPPPTPIKDVVDDVGIKIKDTANREVSLKRPVEDDIGSSKRAYEQNKTTTPNLKRSHGDDELDSRSGRTAEKLSRIDTGVPGGDLKPNLNPTASRGLWSSDNRISRYEGTRERVRSRSPETRKRSASPQRGRNAVYDKHVPRQRSRSPLRRNAYSPDRHAEFHRSILSERAKQDLWCWNCEQSGHHPRDCTLPRQHRENEVKTVAPYEDPRSSPFEKKRSEVKLEHEHGSQSIGGYRATSVRPAGQYLNHQPTNYRGRGRGGRGSFFYPNRGGYKPYRPEGTNEAHFSGAGASLNLGAGG